MWQANDEQRSRILSLVQGFEEEIPSLWEIPPIIDAKLEQKIMAALWTDQPPEKQVDVLRYSGYLNYRPKLSDAAFERLDRRLQERFGEAFLDSAMAEFLVFPNDQGLPNYWFEGCEARRCIARFARSVANDWVSARGTAYAVELIAERLKYLLAHLEEDPEFLQPELRESRKWFHHDATVHFHHLEDFTRLLIQLHRQPPALTFIKQWITGEWDGPLNAFGLRTRYQAIGKDWYGREPLLDETIRTEILTALCEAEQLSYEEFELIRRHLPRFLPYSLFQINPRKFADGSVAKQTLFAFAQRSNWELAQDINAVNIHELRQFPFNLYGAKWLLLACRHIEERELSSIETAETDSSYSASNILQIFCRIAELEPDDTADRILQQLRTFSRRTLLAVAPYVCTLEERTTEEGGYWAVRGILNKQMLFALEWDDLLPLFDWIQHAGEQFRVGSIDVIDQQELKEILAALDSDRVSALLDSGLVGTFFKTQLDAMTGRSRKQIMASLKRGAQTAMRQYGLLPLEDGETVLDRYLALKKIAKDSVKYGAERQTNTRAAVQIGLANFAQTAGFPDLPRLEWAMEAQITDDGFPLNSRETVGDWDVELSLDGLKPNITVFKHGKVLKSVPAGLRKQERFLVVKDAQARIKEQIPRLRETLEKMMVEQDVLTLEDLRQMTCLPVMQALLKDLLVITEQGQLGRLSAKAGEVLELQGKASKIAGSFQLAHPYHFFQAVQLGDWQREVVKQRSVQPFKQVFREFYVLTPAEQQTATFSNRFAAIC